jgi:hypothetical protein
VRTRGSLAGCALLLVLACGCSSGSGKGAPNPTVASTSSVATTTSSVPAATSTTTTAPAGPSVGSLILVTAPDPFVREPDSAADTGPTDLKKAATDDVLSPDAHDALVNAGFVRGYQRQWASSSTVSQNLFIFLYEFATPQGAQTYVQHWRGAILGANEGAVPAPFTPIVPGSFGLAAKDASGSSAVVMYAKGNMAVEVSATGVPNIDQTGPANAAALAQYQLLP